MDSTPGPSPTTTSAPRLARRIRSSPSRRGCPGAAMARASLSGELWRVVTGEIVPAGRGDPRVDEAANDVTSRTAGADRPRRVREPDDASGTVSARSSSTPAGPPGAEAGTTTRSKPSRAALLEAPGQVGDLADLARPVRPRRTAARSAGGTPTEGAEATARATARSAAGSVTRIPPATETKTSTSSTIELGVPAEHGQHHAQAAAVESRPPTAWAGPGPWGSPAPAARPPGCDDPAVPGGRRRRAPRSGGRRGAAGRGRRPG